LEALACVRNVDNFEKYFSQRINFFERVTNEESFEIFGKYFILGMKS
jgi:hypothetical protein